MCRGVTGDTDSKGILRLIFRRPSVSDQGGWCVVIYLVGCREPLKVCEQESARTQPVREEDSSAGNCVLEVPGGYPRLKPSRPELGW